VKYYNKWYIILDIMDDSIYVIELIGYIFSILAIIAAAHNLIERLFHYSLFDAFIKFGPFLLKSLVPHEPFYLWLECRTLNKNIYETWDVVLFYFISLTMVFSFVAGFWIILVLKILSIIHISIYILIPWFLILLVANSKSAYNQAAINFKTVYFPNLENAKQIKEKMTLEPLLTFKLYIKHFFRNWPLTPYNTLTVLLIVILILVLYWPAWLIQAIQRKNKLDLSNEKTRATYFMGYFLFFAIIGLTLNLIS